MKVELLASILEKDAAEFSSTLNLEDGVDEVSQEVAQKEISEYISELKISKLSEGKTQGEGMAKRLVRTEIESLMKRELGVEGKFDEMVESLKAKLSGTKETNNDDNEKQSLALKAKISDLEETIFSQKSKFLKIESDTKVKGKLGSLIDTFEFATPKVKQVAVDSYLNSRKFTFSDDDIFIDNNGTLSAKFNEDVEKHFLDFAVKKQPKEKKPTSLKIDSTDYGNDLSELNKQYSNATTADEKKAILAKIKTIMASKN
jgi:hypothetical protein